MLGFSRKGISSVLGEIMITIIVIVTVVTLYYVIPNLNAESASRSGVLCGQIRVDYAFTSGNTVHFTVRNVGDCKVLLDSIYLLDAEGNCVASYSIHGRVQLVAWGGDRWHLSFNGARKVSSGLIFYDEFNSLSTNLWRKISYNAARYNVWVSTGYLRVRVSSTSSGSWAVAGVASRASIELPDSYVVEVELYKYGRASWDYAVCLYFTSSSASDNPYYNTPWMAFKLYPRGYYTWLQVVYRSSTGSISYRNVYPWSGSSYPHAHLLALVEPGSIRIWVWPEARSLQPAIEGLSYSIVTLTGSNAYVYLTVDNPTTYIDEGLFGYIKVYRDTKVTLEGLKTGATYTLVDAEGRTCVLKASSPSVEVDFLNPPSGCEGLKDWIYLHGFPWRGYVESEALRSLEPGEAYSGSVSIVDSSQNIVYIKICTSDGFCALSPIRR